MYFFWQQKKYQRREHRLGAPREPQKSLVYMYFFRRKNHFQTGNFITRAGIPRSNNKISSPFERLFVDGAKGPDKRQQQHGNSNGNGISENSVAQLIVLVGKGKGAPARCPASGPGLPFAKTSAKGRSLFALVPYLAKPCPRQRACPRQGGLEGPLRKGATGRKQCGSINRVSG